MNGHPVKYLFYEPSGKSVITIPRAIIEANNLDWNHQDEIRIIFKIIDGQEGLFLSKKKGK